MTTVVIGSVASALLLGQGVAGERADGDQRDPVGEQQRLATGEQEDVPAGVHGGDGY